MHRPDIDETCVNLSKRRGVQVERSERSSDRCLAGVSSDEASNSWQQRLEEKPPDGGGNGEDERERARESAESETGAVVGLLRESKLSRINKFLMVSYDRGTKSDMVQCIVVRDVSPTGWWCVEYSLDRRVCTLSRLYKDDACSKPVHFALLLVPTARKLSASADLS